MQTLQQRLAEQAPAEKAKQLKKQKQHIDTLVQDTQKYLEQLSDENYRRSIAAKKKSILKKTAYFGGKRGVSSYVLTMQVLKTAEWTPSVVDQRQKDLLEVLIDRWELA